MAYKKYEHRFDGVTYYCDKLKQNLMALNPKISWGANCCDRFGDEVFVYIECECGLRHEFKVNSLNCE